jgi:glycosyltransferase involved in cell wall biosynthesis
MRVLMLSKALVTSVYQQKLEELAALPDIELLAVVPPHWLEGRVGAMPLVRRPSERANYELAVEPMRFNGHHHTHYYPGLARRMREFKPDLVHIDEEPFNLVAAHAMRLARRHKARTVFFTWQNLHRRYPPPFSTFERYVYARANAAMSGSEEAADVLRRKGFKKRIDVIPQFGVDPQLYRPLPAPGHEPTIGYYGRLVPEKGVETLIEASGLMPSRPRIVIVGSGEHRVAIEHLAEQMGVRDRVTFRGSLPGEEIPAMLAELDVVVVPSRTMPNWKEQFGRVIVEAMACQVPVIGSDSGEIPNVIGDAGIIFPEGDAEALAVQLDNLLHDPQRAERLGQAGRERVLTRYTHERIARATYELYQDVLAGDRRPQRKRTAAKVSEAPARAPRVDDVPEFVRRG